MQTNLVQDFIIYKLQVPMSNKLTRCSKDYPKLGRVAVIPVAVADVVLETLKTPLITIERLAMSIINFLGAVAYAATKSDLFMSYKKDRLGNFMEDFKNRRIEDPYTLKDALVNFDWALGGAVKIPVACLMAVPKLIYQLGTGLYNPSRFEPYRS